jgi:hypothetical protein
MIGPLKGAQKNETVRTFRGETFVHQMRDMHEIREPLSDRDISQAPEYPREYTSNQIQSCSGDIHEGQK